MQNMAAFKMIQNLHTSGNTQHIQNIEIKLLGEKFK